MMSIPIAIQLYTLRNELELDFRGTLEKVAQLGYNGVELAGYAGLKVEEVKDILDELNLKVSSSHVPIERLEQELPQVIKEQKILGSKYIVVPFVLPERRNDKAYYELISFLNETAEQCEKEGLTLCYHNHDFELEHLEDGRKVLKAILDDTKVSAEFDIYWLTKADETPSKWLKNYQGRTPLVHLKDMTLDEEKFFAELGTGGVDLEEVLKMGTENDVQWWVVEQDESRISPLESIEISINHLKKMADN
ncbi:xylose isomerase [Alkalihalobacillus alcalophilus ATCC 27647 = CGMCC 1.3604]|uniref:Xylose isomerase n=2 Tax=Alkalihalobacillus alcalophilus ATCC 27647 = CGMCC 1.3604 TaxID=1218173 RepID=A0A4S4K4B3_ALKAL|nr:sugar phosphate isomerase/epimerase [Alkalihalobacillus alcalophilus]THG90909.1 xylose isomerase [Alkalihalobacillus alcalophilus ATCC 27647 = CGMCC 1.3604]